MEFFVVFKENGKMEYNRSLSEYQMLTMVANQIESEDIDLVNPEHPIQYIGFLPSSYSSVNQYVKYAKENNIVNQPIMVVFHKSRFERFIKIFRKGLPDFTNFVRSSNFESIEEEVFSLSKEFKSFDSLVDDATRNSIGRMIMNRGKQMAVSEMKYEYVGAKISVKSKVPSIK